MTRWKVVYGNGGKLVVTNAEPCDRTVVYASLDRQDCLNFMHRQEDNHRQAQRYATAVISVAGVVAFAWMLAHMLAGFTS